MMKSLYCVYFLWVAAYCWTWDYGYPPQHWNSLNGVVVNPNAHKDYKETELRLLIAIPQETYSDSLLEPIADRLLSDPLISSRIEHQYKKIDVQLILINHELQIRDCPAVSTIASTIRGRRKTVNERRLYRDLFLNIYFCPNNWEKDQMNVLLVLADYLPFYETTARSQFYMYRNYFYAGELNYYSYANWHLQYTLVVATPDVSYYWIKDLRKLQFKFHVVLRTDQPEARGNLIKYIADETVENAMYASSLHGESSNEGRVFIPYSLFNTFSYLYPSSYYRFPEKSVQLRYFVKHHFHVPYELSKAYADVFEYLANKEFEVDYIGIRGRRDTRNSTIQDEEYLLYVYDGNVSPEMIRSGKFPSSERLPKATKLSYKDAPTIDCDVYVLSNIEKFDRVKPIENLVKIAHLFLRRNLARVMESFNTDASFVDSFYDAYVNMILEGFQFIFYSETQEDIEFLNTARIRHHFAWHPYTIVGPMIQAIEDSIVDASNLRNLEELYPQRRLKYDGISRCKILVTIPKYFKNAHFIADAMALISKDGYLVNKLDKTFQNVKISWTLVQYGSTKDSSYRMNPTCNILQLNRPYLDTRLIKRNMDFTTDVVYDGAFVEAYRCAVDGRVFDLREKSELNYIIMISEVHPYPTLIEIVPDQLEQHFFGYFDRVGFSLSAPEYVYQQINQAQPNTPKKSDKNQASDKDKLLDLFSSRARLLSGCARHDVCAFRNFVLDMTE